jgi:SAM-dependent methyltransferase
LILSATNHNDTLVDFGAGNGTFAIPVTSSGHRVICVETDPILSAELRKQGMTVLNDLEKIEDESIEYIYSLNVLEHIVDDEAIVALWNRKLRPGGKLLVYVPAFQSLFSSMDHKVGHIRRYSKAELCQKLRNASFDITESRYADSIGYAATILYKLFDNKDGSVNPKMLKIYDKWIFPLSQLLDTLTYNIWGKNVYVRAVKPINSPQ